MFLEIPHKIQNTCVTVSFLKFIKKETLAQLFSMNFAKFLSIRTLVSQNASCWQLMLLFIDFSRTFFSPLQLVIGTLHSVCLFYNLAIFHDSYLSSVLFLIPKIEFVSSFAVCLCALFSISVCRMSVVTLCYWSKSARRYFRGYS